MIGSEIDWASKKRKYRGAKKRAKGMTMSSNCLPNVRQEIDIELEKEGEIEMYCTQNLGHKIGGAVFL